MSDHDPEIWQKARKALPLPELMRRLNHGGAIPARHGGAEKTPECPFCGDKKGKWGIGIKGDRWWFKCQRTSCEANDAPAGQGEIGFLALSARMSDKDAAREYLKLAVPELVPHLFPENNPGQPSKSSAPQNASAAHTPPPRPQRDPKNPWDELVMRLPLTGPDSGKLLKKRGLSPESQELFCIRSNNAGNRAIVAGLAARWDEHELVELGILKHERGKQPRPAGQLCGYGRTGRWKRGGAKPADHEDEEEWSEEVEPPLIPYFGPDGIPFYLRPHKGGITNQERRELEATEVDYLDDADSAEINAERECAAHVWFPPNFRELLELSDGVAVLTEGEFKAMAACQCGIACCAAPGISFIRNPAFKRELIRTLSLYGVRELIIIFDNEVKDDPRFPNYKADPQKRCDTEVWAEFTMLELRPHFRAAGGDVLVGMLPDELRIEGKADFDGILAQCVAELGIAEGTRKARKIFRTAMNGASGQPNRELFATQKRKTIERRLHMKYVKRRIPFGGGREMALAARLAEWDDAAKQPVDRELADALRAVKGCYYEWKNAPKSSPKDVPPEGSREHYLLVLLPEVQGLIKAAKEAKQYDRLRILRARESSLYLRLKGMPEAMSTCVLRGEFKLHIPGGQTCRMVRVFDARRRGGALPPLRRLDPSDCKAGSSFRPWVQGTGEGDWMGGEIPLQHVIADINDELHERDIHAVTSAGYHAETRCWFFGDSAYLDDMASREGRGIELLPDENGVFWIDGVGFHIDLATADDPSARTFSLGFPLLQNPQGMKTTDLFDDGNPGDLLQTSLYEWSKIPRFAKLCGPVLKLALAMSKREEKQDLHALLAACSTEVVSVESPWLKDDLGQTQFENMPFRDAVERELATILLRCMAEDLRQTIGDHDAWAAIGAILAFTLGPELVQEYHCHPGLWMSGPFGDGKSESALMMVRMLGMKDQALKLTKDLTAVGMNRTLAQYSSLPVNFDEFRRDMEDVKAREHVMRSSTERGASPKGTIRDATSTRSVPLRTSPVISGEHSSEDPATRSRFLHIAVNKARRLPGSPAAWERLKAFRPHFYHIGRWVMKRRRAFAADTLSRLGRWMSDPEVKLAVDKERIRLSSGVGFCAFSALAGMLGLFQDAMPDFKSCMMKLGNIASSTASEETFRNAFWNALLEGLGRQTSGIKADFFSIRPCWLKDSNGAMLPTNAIPDFTEAQPVEGEAKSAGEWVKKMLATKRYKLAILNDRQAEMFPALATVGGKKFHGLPVMFMAQREVFGEYQRDTRTKGEAIKIGIADLRDECSKEPWFLPGEHIQKIGENKGSTRCWAIALDTFPLADDFALKLEREADPE